MPYNYKKGYWEDIIAYLPLDIIFKIGITDDTPFDIEDYGNNGEESNITNNEFIEEEE